MTAQAPVTLRAPTLADRIDWDRLYAGYAAFYKVDQTADMRDRVWSWLHDPAAPTEGLMAADANGRLVGLAHFRPYPRPLSASTGGFLDDLFVSPEVRGQGVAAALIDGVCAIATARGWTVLRWITAEDNLTARHLYDRVAAQTPWVTYDIRL